MKILRVIIRAIIGIIGAVLAVLLLLYGYFYFETSSQFEALESSKNSPALHIKHVIPSRSPLRLSKSSELDHLLYFDGTVEIAAKYQFTYEENSERTSNPFLNIYPDKRSMGLLPYLPENGEKGYPSKIYVRNPDVVAKSMFDKQFHSKLMNGSFPSVSGETVVTIQGYWAGYECDQPAFVARIVNVKSVNEKRSYKRRGRNTGC